MRNHILPFIGNLYLDEITRQHIVQMLAAHSPGHAPASTNRVLVLTRTIFNCALRWETPGITKNATDKATLLPVNNERERFLDANEMRRLFRALDDSDAKMLKHIIAMLMLTGARKSEVLNAKWLDFDLINFSWRIEFNKSGKTRYVPLSHNAVALIKQLPTIPGCEYAFANPKTKRPFVSIYNSWNTARKKAGLSDVRIHDIRHSHASLLVNRGHSLYEVQKILGHTQIKTTQRYAHLSQERLLAATNDVADFIDSTLLIEDTKIINNAA
ncbi:MAG: site-specific integrase [Marinobacter sp.]|nr:site-specific integrase [Marinobacter sp.]MCL1481505.1 site-specific integrase [Marinobacter sp.]